MQRLFFILCMATSALAAEETRWFVNQNLVYERGTELSEQYLKQHAPDFSKKLPALLPWVVRIEVQHSFTGNGYSSNHGTGVILENGAVLTAHHVLTENVGDGKIKVILTLVDGRVFPAVLEKHGKKDWAHLRLNPEAVPDELLHSPIRIEVPISGETAVFFGYPAQLGMDKQGRVQPFHKGHKKEAIPASSLSPMLVVASVEDREAMKLKPLAGFPPAGGMSGGPIFNLNGCLIAVQHSVSKTTDNATGGILYYKIDAVPSDLLKPSSGSPSK